MTHRTAVAHVLGLALLLGAGALSSGCDVVGGISGLPSAALNSVDLVQSPSAQQMGVYGCYEYSSFCSVLGSKPSNEQMQMSFDLVFDVTNNSQDVPIPLVEVLLGLTVFEEDNLGVTCISFCDPEDENCTPTTDAEGACQADNSGEVKDGSDLIPSVDDLVGIGDDVANNGADNWDFKYIPPGETVEAHIQFDLGTQTMTQVGKKLFQEAAEDAVKGNKVQFIIPYTTEGTLFFDLPNKSRRGVGFGPFDSEWNVQ